MELNLECFKQLKSWSVSNLNYFPLPLKSLKDITAASTRPAAFSCSVLFKEPRVKTKTKTLSRVSHISGRLK